MAGPQRSAAQPAVDKQFSRAVAAAPRAGRTHIGAPRPCQLPVSIGGHRAPRGSRSACLAQALGCLQVDRDKLADAALHHGHPEQPVMRAMVTGWWVMIRKRVSARSSMLFSSLQNRSTLCVVERGIDLVQHADRRRVGEEHREDQGQRREACSPPDSSDSTCGRLPGGWARISRPASSGSSDSISRNSAWPPPNRVVNSRRNGRSPLRRPGEAFATLAVQIGDALAEALDGLHARRRAPGPGRPAGRSTPPPPPRPAG